jgi:hypothetical protein
MEDASGVANSKCCLKNLNLRRGRSRLVLSKTPGNITSRTNNDSLFQPPSWHSDTVSCEKESSMKNQRKRDGGAKNCRINTQLSMPILIQYLQALKCFEPLISVCCV